MERLFESWVDVDERGLGVIINNKCCGFLVFQVELRRRRYKSCQIYIYQMSCPAPLVESSLRLERSRLCIDRIKKIDVNDVIITACLWLYGCYHLYPFGVLSWCQKLSD